MSTQENSKKKSKKSIAEKLKTYGKEVRRKLIASSKLVGDVADAFFDPKGAVEDVEGQSMEDFAKESDKRQAEKELKGIKLSAIVTKEREDRYLD